MGESWYFAEFYDIIESIEEKNYGIIYTEMIGFLRADNKVLKNENAELSQKVEWLMEQLRLLKKKQFGASREQTKGHLNRQLSLLFNESEESSVIPDSFASAEAIAHILTQKFVMTSPLCRQEQEWAR